MEQIRIETEIARRLAREGQERALDRAERDTPSWGDLALAWLRRYAERHAEFPAWFATQEAERDPDFPAPSNPRAWGAIWKRAQRERIVRASGRTLPHPKRHGCPAVVWMSLVYEAKA